MLAASRRVARPTDRQRTSGPFFERCATSVPGITSAATATPPSATRPARSRSPGYSYKRRVLYRVVRDHGETFYQAVEDGFVSAALPSFVRAGPRLMPPLRSSQARLGSHGPDLLYELRTNTTLRKRVDDLLTSEAVRAKATDALLIADDLGRAKGCVAKTKLLERVIKDGDDRSVRILQPLITRSKRGCGILALAACPARCAVQASQIRRAIDAARARTRHD